MSDNFEIAYFASPGRRPSGTHLLLNDKPVCGYKPKGEKQIVSRLINLNLLDCHTCNDYVSDMTAKWHGQP